MYKEKECQMKGCKNIFIPTSGSQKYCSECKEKAKRDRERIQWRKQSRKRNNSKEYQRECLACGKEFFTFYSKKVYCGSNSCKIERVKRKNKMVHERRSREELTEKGRKYYKNNREKCLLKHASDYRDKYPDAKKYVSGKINKHTIEFVRGYVKNYDYELLSTTYVNNRSKIKLKCPMGHYWETSFHNFKDGAARCFTCYIMNNYTSKFELEVKKFVKSIYNGRVVYNDRTIIFNNNTNKFLELDLYFPELNKAIECDGVYWHSRKETMQRDKIKTKLCNKNSINLLRITDKEWPSKRCAQKINNFLSK